MNKEMRKIFVLMKYLLILTITLLSVFVYGQFPEFDNWEITGQHVKTIKVYQYNYQRKLVDTSLHSLEIYNSLGNLIERRNFFGRDTSSYKGELYTYDSINHSVIKKKLMVNAPSPLCYSRTVRPSKKIEKTNDKRQLILVEEYYKGTKIEPSHLLKLVYIYGTNDLLEQVNYYFDKKLEFVYKIYYEYY